MLARILAVAVGLLLLAACQSAGSSHEGATAITTPDSTTVTANADDVFAMLKGHGFKVEGVKEDRSDKAQWITGAYDFKLDGQEAHLVTFEDMDALASWTEMLKGFGGTAVASTNSPWSIQIGNTDVMEQKQVWKALATKVAAAVGSEED
jgi:hypothetical protein